MISHCTCYNKLQYTWKRTDGGFFYTTGSIYSQGQNFCWKSKTVSEMQICFFSVHFNYFKSAPESSKYELRENSPSQQNTRKLNTKLITSSECKKYTSEYSSKVKLCTNTTFNLIYAYNNAFLKMVIITTTVYHKKIIIKYSLTSQINFWYWKEKTWLVHTAWHIFRLTDISWNHNSFFFQKKF